MEAWVRSAFGTCLVGKAWNAIIAYFAVAILASTSSGRAAEEPVALELVRTATADSAASYGGIAVDTATVTLMKDVLGEPISAKDQSCTWIATEGCRSLGLKMVRASYTEDGVLSHVTLDVQKPFARSEAVESLGLGDPVEVRHGKGVTIELFPSANLALGVHRDRVIRLYLFGSRTPGMAKPKPAMSPEDAQELLETAVATVTQEEKDSALRVAVAAGCAEAVVGFLACGANPMAPNSQGGTALHDAAFAGHAEIVAPLVFGSSLSGNQDGKGAEPINAILDKRNNDGASALFLACLAGHFETAKTLLRMGADPNVADGKGRTPLHLAALADSVELVEVLLLSRAEVYARTKRGRSPLDLATDKETRRLLTQTATRDGEDSAKAQVGKVIEKFLQATCEGDLDKLKSCVLPSLRKGMPDEVEEDAVQWSVKSIHFEAGAASVLCDLTQPSESSEACAQQTRFRLQYAEDAWWITDVETEPQPNTEVKQGESS